MRESNPIADKLTRKNLMYPLLTFMVLFIIWPSFKMNVNAERKLINKAYVGFALPAVGTDTTVVPDLSVPEGEHYYIQGADWLDGNTCVLDAPLTFEKGKTYGMIIIIQAEKGYYFDEKSTAFITNGTPDHFHYDDYPDSDYSCLQAIIRFHIPEDSADGSGQDVNSQISGDKENESVQDHNIYDYLPKELSRAFENEDGYDAIECGRCGEDVVFTEYWSKNHYDDTLSDKAVDRCLVISGSGAMWNYTYEGRGYFTSYSFESTAIVDGITFKYHNDYKLREAIIEDGITSIGNYFFYGSKIDSITIPDTVTTIGSYAFARSTIDTLIIPDSVKVISKYAFDNATINNLVMPKNATIIDDSSNNGGNSQERTITNRRDNIECNYYYLSRRGNCGDNLVYYIYYSNEGKDYTIVRGSGPMWDYKEEDPSFTSYPMDNGTYIFDYGITSIGEYAFDDDSNINVILPETVTRISEYAFNEAGIQSIEIPGNNVTIGSHCFNNSNIDSLVISGDYPIIKEYAFLYAKIKSLLFTGKINTIGDRAFYCSHMKTITIPYGTKTIGKYAFANSYLTSITIPDSVTSIGRGAFSCNEVEYHSYLKKVTLSKNITSLPPDVFSGCYQLKSVIIPSKVTSIGSYAFADCEKLKSINIPSKVTLIGRFAFAGAGFKSVTVPERVKKINNHTFSSKKLKKVIIKSKKSVAVDKYAFDPYSPVRLTIKCPNMKKKELKKFKKIIKKVNPKIIVKK